MSASGNGTKEAAEEDNTDHDDQDSSAEEKEKTYCWGHVKKKTLLLIWGTITVTLTNFGYFTGGYYAFNYFQAQYYEEQGNKTVLLLAQQETLLFQYPQLYNETTMLRYGRTAELLCHITRYPRKRWSFWAAFDFCVSIVTTVGYGVLHPTSWYSKAVCCCYAMAGLPLYIIMLGAAGKYIVSMFEYLNEKSGAVKTVCKHKYMELIIAYINIAIIMALFLFGYSYFGYSSSRQNEIYGNSTPVLSLSGYNYKHTANEISVYGNNWTMSEAVYYSMISLTTVGFGDYYLGRPDDPRQAAMLFASVTFGFALFSYAFQTYAKASEETLKYLRLKSEAVTKAAAAAAQAEMGDLAVTGVAGFMDKMDKISLTGVSDFMDKLP